MVGDIARSLCGLVRDFVRGGYNLDEKIVRAVIIVVIAGLTGFGGYEAALHLLPSGPAVTSNLDALQGIRTVLWEKTAEIKAKAPRKSGGLSPRDSFRAEESAAGSGVGADMGQCALLVWAYNVLAATIQGSQLEASLLPSSFDAGFCRGP